MNKYYKDTYNYPPDFSEPKTFCMFCGIPVEQGYYCSTECKDADTHEKS